MLSLGMYTAMVKRGMPRMSIGERKTERVVSYIDGFNLVFRAEGEQALNATNG